MTSIITNNPFRILGVYSNSGLKEITANKTKLSAYAKVGKRLEFKSDKIFALDRMERGDDAISKSISAINLPHDKLKYSLFWFLQDSPTDKIAISHLEVENTDKAIEIFSKQETFSSLINLGVLCLLRKEYGKSVACITKVIHDNHYRAQFISAIAGVNAANSTDELAHLYIDTLLTEYPEVNWRKTFVDSGESADDDEYIKSASVKPIIREIQSLISKASNIPSNDPKANYDAGVHLQTKTDKALSSLCNILGVDSMEYKNTVDKVAEQILECGINYFNNIKNDDDALEKTLKLQKFALSIVIGELTKGRCKENVEILREMQKTLPPKEIRAEIDKITKELELFDGRSSTIASANILLSNCTPYLVRIKERVGKSNSHYITISTTLAHRAMNNVIKDVNSQSSKVIIAAWQTTINIGVLDTDTNFKRDRYNPSKSTLESIIEQSITYSFSLFTTTVPTLYIYTEEEYYNICSSLSDYENFLTKYPNGRYKIQAQDKHKIEKNKETRSILIIVIAFLIVFSIVLLAL